MNPIKFNKPYFSGKEAEYMRQSIESGKISGDGRFTTQCHEFFQSKYGFKKALLTSSCTDALEMAAILFDIKAGDEVIAPSFTFVSSVNAFVLRGAIIKFIDSNSKNPNLDLDELEKQITSKTKAIIVVHYAGIANDMDRIMAISKKHGIWVVEDAAHSIDSFYKKKPLGSIAHLGAFSFHETKNITCGEGGLLVINDEQFIQRAEIIREKGTNRSSFLRGEVEKYEWVDIGSSYLPSDMIAAFLYAQLESLVPIQQKRKAIWEMYLDGLCQLKEKNILLPSLPEFATNNAHLFYLVLESKEQRQGLIDHLRSKNIASFFHYQSLHRSPFYVKKYGGIELKNSDRYSDCLLRLPIYFEMTDSDVKRIIAETLTFFN